MASIFSKIFSGEIPGKFIHQDELCGAIVDITPQAPTHILIVPRKEIQSISTSGPSDGLILGHLLLVAGKIARDHGYDKTGYRLVINNGEHAGQTVPHLHVHLLAGRPFTWPPG